MPSLKLIPSTFLKLRKPLLKWIAWFSVGNIFLFWLIGTQYILAITPLIVPANLFLTQILAWALLITGFVGQLTLLALLPTILLILPLIFCCYHIPKFIICSAVISFTCAATLLFADAIIFKKFHYHLNGIILELIMHHDMQQIFDFSWLEYAIAATVFVTLLLLEGFYALYVWQKLILHLPTRLALKNIKIAIGCLFFSYVIFILAEAQQGLGLNKEMLALPLYENFLSALLPKKYNLSYLSTLGYGNFIQLNYPNKKLHYPIQPLNCQQTAKPLNIVIIAIDAWRFDMINESVTPHLANFAKSNWQFLQHFSGGNGTQPGIFSLFYGLPANYWTATTEQKRGPLLIDELLRQHYQTGIFTSATLDMPAFNLNVFSAIKNLQLFAPGKNSATRDQKLTQQFKQFIKHVSQSKQPFFTFLFYDSAHNYCAPSNINQRFQPSVKTCNRLMPTNTVNFTAYLNRYKNSLYFIDDLIGQDLAELNKQHLLDNTVVIITSDHGEEFDDNHIGNFGHASNFTHYQTQTPLLIHWPEKTTATFKYTTSHYDIAPTLLTNVLGCKNPARDYSIGHALLDKHQSNHLLIHSYTSFGIVEPERITTIFPTGNYQITDLNGRSIPNAQLHLNVLKQTLDDMSRFIKK